MRGTWEVTDYGRGSSRVVVLVIGALLLFGSGAAAAVATAVLVAVIALAVVVVLGVAGLAALLVHRTRQNRPGGPLSARVVSRLPPDPAPGLENPYKAAIEAPREIHLHFHGTSAEQAAEILRHCQPPE